MFNRKRPSGYRPLMRKRLGLEWRLCLSTRMCQEMAQRVRYCKLSITYRDSIWRFLASPFFKRVGSVAKTNMSHACCRPCKALKNREVLTALAEVLQRPSPQFRPRIPPPHTHTFPSLHLPLPEYRSFAKSAKVEAGMKPQQTSFANIGFSRKNSTAPSWYLSANSAQVGSGRETSAKQVCLHI